MSMHTSMGRYGRALLTGALGVALGATTLAACSSSPKATTTTTTSNVPGVTATSIDIGASCRSPDRRPPGTTRSPRP